MFELKVQQFSENSVDWCIHGRIFYVPGNLVACTYFIRVSLCTTEYIEYTPVVGKILCMKIGGIDGLWSWNKNDGEK